MELSDEIWHKFEKKRLRHERTLILQTSEPLVNIQVGGDRAIETPKYSRTTLRRFLYRVQFAFDDIRGWISPDAGPRIAVAASTEEKSFADPGTVSAEYIVGRDMYTTYQLHFGKMRPEEIQQRLFLVNEHQKGKQPIVLQPGDSVVKHFILRTLHWLTFTPISYVFQIQVKYQIDELIHVDTVPFSVNIRAATGSSLIGAVIGSVLGTIVNPKTIAVHPSNMILTFLTPVIFAVIIVVAFARKSNVQQIVSVEDFWGGVFIGFLVGYSGQSFVQQILGTP